MKTTGAILGIIGGLLGIIGGYLTQTMGDFKSFFEVDNADMTILLGRIILILSLIILVLSCFIFKRPKLFGAIILVFGIVYIIMANYISGALILAGGVLGVLSQQPNLSQSLETIDKKKMNWACLKKLTYKRCFIILGILLLAGTTTFGAYKIIRHYQVINAEKKCKEGLALIKEKQYRKAVPYLFDAANYDNIDAQIGMVECYIGLNNIDSCLIWVRRVAYKNEKATFFSTRIYAFIVESGAFSAYEDEAFVFLSRIAENHHNPTIQGAAQIGLANSYKYGRGVELNYREAISWYKKAAQNGSDEIAKLNQKVPVGYFVYDATDFKYRKSVGSGFYNETADGLYLIVDVAITNRDKESRLAAAGSCFLVDENGYKYEHNTNASTAMEIQGYNTFSMKPINPGITSKGIMVFEVPRKADYYLFVAGDLWNNAYTPVLLQQGN